MFRLIIVIMFLSISSLSFAQLENQCARDIEDQLDLFVEEVEGEITGLNQGVYVVTDDRSRKSTAIRLKDKVLGGTKSLACKAICNKNAHKTCGFVAACVDGLMSDVTGNIPVCSGLWLFSEEALVAECGCES